MKKKVIGMLIIILIIMIGTSVQAVDNTFKASVSPTSKVLKPGEEIEITISVSDINMGTNGINTLEGTIEYDKNIFETVVSNNIKSLNNWTTTFNDENSTLNGKFLAVNLASGIKEDMNIFSVKFKVKSNATSGTTQIKFKDITSNNSIDLINVGTKTVDITIESNKIPAGNNNTNSNTNKTNSIKAYTDSQSKTSLPKTGVSKTMIFMIGVILVYIIVLGIKNIKMRDIK